VSAVWSKPITAPGSWREVFVVHRRVASRVAVVSAGARRRPATAHERSIAVGGDRDGEPSRGRPPDIRTPALNVPKGTTVCGFIAVDTVKLALLSGGELTIIPQPGRRLNTARRSSLGQQPAWARDRPDHTQSHARTSVATQMKGTRHERQNR